MDIFEPNKILLFIAFVIPGFVSLKAYELFFLARSKNSNSQLIDAITYSCLNYAILLSPIYYINIHTNMLKSNSFYVALIIFFALFIAPILWVFLIKLVRNTQWLQKCLPHPTERAWDYIFENKKPYWVIVKLVNGTNYAGKYAYKSFSSSGAANLQIYLEEAWSLNSDGGFEHVRATTSGILIVTSEIESIEFFQYIEDITNE
jgi:hypothetical protein